MRLRRDDPNTVKMGVFDAAGQQLPYVVSFDTETSEIEMFIKLKDEEAVKDSDERFLYLAIADKDGELKPFAAKFVLPGAYAMDETGKVLK